jgi:anti-anti-sigma regulatory factor
VDEDTDRSLCIARRWTGGATLLLELTGRLDTKSMTRLAICANDICNAPVRNVHIALTGLASVDDTGYRTLAAFCRILLRRGHRLVLLGARSLVEDVLDRLSLTVTWNAEGATWNGEGGVPGVAARAVPGSDGQCAPLLPGERQALRLMERDLAGQEPRLGAMFAAFDRLADD